MCRSRRYEDVSSLRFFQSVTNAVNAGLCVIAGDLNAKHEVWNYGLKETSDDGSSRLHEGCTFQMVNIRTLMIEVTGWTANKEGRLSGHHNIHFEVSRNQVAEVPGESCRLITAKTN